MKTDLSPLTRDELVAWFRAEIDKAETSGEPQSFDAEAFKKEMAERHGRPSEQDEN